ncbi:prepilin-type N-terminal cleavage/methylation domain-containing protein [Paenibacillus pedocola]|uniref:prepilin-type N-terminal cleavage/methylation domain-containing protein n=1 Tax=Paenibacillus pedocola TaxID=3242193 RepID=UPI002877A861|nr:prepilin-type N-terminal cleavage/methylation domain-containing protein [Paenibacillus typhae]
MLAQAIKKRLSKEENQKGFTLIELLAVIIILGIIAVIAIPMISGIINNTKEDSDLATARQVYEAARMYTIAEKEGVFTSTAAYSITVETLKSQGYLEPGIVLPSTKEALANASKVTFSADGTLADTAAVDLRTATLDTDSEAKQFSEEEILKTKRTN